MNVPDFPCFNNRYFLDSDMNLEKIHSEKKLHDLNSLTDFIRLAKSRNWRWPGRVARRREMHAFLWL